MRSHYLSFETHHKYFCQITSGHGTASVAWSDVVNLTSLHFKGQEMDSEQYDFLSVSPPARGDLIQFCCWGIWSHLKGKMLPWLTLTEPAWFCCILMSPAAPLHISYKYLDFLALLRQCVTYTLIGVTPDFCLKPYNLYIITEFLPHHPWASFWFFHHWRWSFHLFPIFFHPALSFLGPVHNVPLMFLPGRSLLVLVYMLDHCLYRYATKSWTITGSCAFTKVSIIISRAEISLIKMQNKVKKNRNTDHPLLPSARKSWLTSETILTNFVYRRYSQSAITFVTSDSFSLLFPSTLVNICIMKFLWCWNAATILETSPDSVENVS